MRYTSSTHLPTVAAYPHARAAHAGLSPASAHPATHNISGPLTAPTRWPWLGRGPSWPGNWFIHYSNRRHL